MKERYKYGISFWIGGGIYSLINAILNYTLATRNDILFYNYLITGVSVAGLILKIFLWKRADQRKQ